MRHHPEADHRFLAVFAVRRRGNFFAPPSAMPQPSVVRSAVTQSLIHRLKTNRDVAEWPRRWRTAAAPLLAAVNRPLQIGGGAGMSTATPVGALTRVRVMRWLFWRDGASTS